MQLCKEDQLESLPGNVFLRKHGKQQMVLAGMGIYVPLACGNKIS